MNEQDVSMEELRVLARNWVLRVLYGRLTPATLGRPNTPNYDIDFPGGHGFVYVVPQQGADGTMPAKALNRSTLVMDATNEGKAIWLDRDPDGNYIIVFERYEGA